VYRNVLLVLCMLSLWACQTHTQAVAQVVPQLQSHADECASAKQQVVDATTTDQVDLAMRKVNILCND